MNASVSAMRAQALRAAVAMLCLTAGSVTAATDPPASDPAAGTPAAASTAQPVVPPSKVVPLNSGVSPHEFEADPSKVTTEILPDGTGLDHLNGQGMQAVVAHIGADGKIEYTCTDQAEHATQAGSPAANIHEQ